MSMRGARKLRRALASTRACRQSPRDYGRQAMATTQATRDMMNSHDVA